MSSRQLGLATVAILDAVRRGRRYGLEIIDETGLGGGTVYKLLHRLEKRAMVKGSWESADVAERERRPRRRYYRVTSSGERALAESLEKMRALTTAAGVMRPRRSSAAREG